MLEVWTDGASAADGTKTQAGWIIKRNGELLIAGHQRFGEGWSDSAEYHAIICAFKDLLKFNLQDEEILWRGDSRFVIKQMSGEYKVSYKARQKQNEPRSYVPLYSEAQELLKQFKSIEFQWVPREENEEADAMSVLA